jgi:hypothetical integral membrane protein (TIGR02206 family)
MESAITLENGNFVAWSSQHLLAISFFFLFGFLYIYLFKRFGSNSTQNKAGIAFGIFLALVVVLWSILELLLGRFDIKSDLPFHLCNLLALLAPILATTKNRYLYEIVLFWILGGTLQAVITPDLANGFPHYNFFKYWTIHCGLVIMVFYMTFVHKLYPTRKSIWKSYLVLQCYFLLMIGINYLLDANYMYLNQKPPQSLLDFFGPWPIYIFISQLIVIPYFFLMYLPFYLARPKTAKLHFNRTNKTNSS